jgi:catechol 2,3-dioxygenase-like lactoylglutathione lyase family enzyme
MRFQLALNVADLEQAVAYYSKLFGVAPHKRKPGYANFAVEDPPLKLVLFEAPGAAERLNHVGFEYPDNEPVEAMIRRLEPAGLATSVDRDEACCWAKKSTVWAADPQGLRWEFYRVKEDSETFGAAPAEPEPAAPSCGTGACAPPPTGAAPGSCC